MPSRYDTPMVWALGFLVTIRYGEPDRAIILVPARRST